MSGVKAEEPPAKPWLSTLASVAGLCATSALMLACDCPTNKQRTTQESSGATESTEPFRELARHFAPRIYQDTDDSYPLGDYITNFDFDGDYNGKNNWEALAKRTSVPAYVYYAVSETETHYFIQFSVFHPRDWHEWLVADMHENDLEGISLAIEKTGGFGTLIAMETMAHDEFYQYSASPDVTEGSETIDGRVRLSGGSHPEIFVEAKGHGIYGCDERCDNAPGGDGIVYSENDNAESPAAGDGNFSRTYGYELIAMDSDGAHGKHQGLWYRRNDICDTCTFGAWGKLRGDNYGTNRAKTAWAWDDPDDKGVFAGAMQCDPAWLFDAHFSGSALEAGYSHTYVSHVYATHWFQVSAVQSGANLDLGAGPSDLYVRVIAPGSPAGSDDLFNAQAWQVDDAELGTWYSLAERGFGASRRGFRSAAAEHYFCRASSTETRFEVYDSDDDADDLMGASVLQDSADFSGGVSLEHAGLRFAYNVR